MTKMTDVVMGNVAQLKAEINRLREIAFDAETEVARLRKASAKQENEIERLRAELVATVALNAAVHGTGYQKITTESDADGIFSDIDR